jgi:ABC-2 type transport system permease protein
MLTVFGHALGRFKWQIVAWGGSLGILGGYMMTFYDTIVEQQQQLQNLLSSWPPSLMAFFGDVTKMLTAGGYLTIEFFSYMPLILGIFAVLAGSGLLAGDEENGTMDLVLAHPVSRTVLFFGRLAAFVLAIIGILALCWLGFMIGMPWAKHLGVRWDQLMLPFASLGAVLLLFGALSLLMSMVLPARRLADMVGGVVLVASYFVTSLARIDESLRAAARFSPLNYYQAGDAIEGRNGLWLAGLVGVALVFVLLAWWRFERRDIRVGGEGSWGWGLPGRRKSPEA